MPNAEQARRGAAALAALASLVACTPPHTTPEAYELANIGWWNVVPKSSPAQFTDMFETVCLDTEPKARPARLRAAGYVPRPSPAAHDLWVVDDRRPLVMTAPSRARCAVVAEARTGQADAVRRMVLRRFSGARAVAPESLGAGVERAWQTGGGTHVVTLREGAPTAPSRLMLALVGPDGGQD